MQQWWQKKLSIFIGIGGALILMLQSVIAALVWPVYDILRDPLTILTASDAPYRAGFVTLQLVAMTMILLSLWAILQQYKNRHQDMLAKRLQELGVVFGIYIGVTVVMPRTMAHIALQTGLTLNGLIDAVYVSIIIVLLYLYSQAAFADDQLSLGNAILLLAILFGLFHMLEFGVELLGWPLRGFFDVLAMDTLAAAFAFICWYYARKTAI